MKLLIIAGDMMMSIFANLEKMGTGPIFFVFFFWFLAWRRLYGEKTVRKAEWNKWGLSPFILHFLIITHIKWQRTA